MSIHKSLNLGGGISSVRSVWTRRERIDKLIEEDRFSENDPATGLPKVRTQYKVLTRKQMKAAAAAAADADGSVEAGEGGEGGDSGENAESTDEA